MEVLEEAGLPDGVVNFCPGSGATFGNDLIELRNLVLTAHLIVRSAQRRKESRGLHFSRDYPELLPAARDTVLKPGH